MWLRRRRGSADLLHLDWPHAARGARTLHRADGADSLPPRWALGYHQSRWGYRPPTSCSSWRARFGSARIPRRAVSRYRLHGRLSSLHLGLHRFPDPSGLVRELDGLGVKLVTILDPGIKLDENYAVYTSGRDDDLFCKTLLGDEYHNVVWPGMCAFPDFTNPRARTWWGDHLTVLLDAGVAGIWCDMNEPTVFVPTPQTLPDDVTHHGEGEAVLHAQVHNLYGQLMARATHEGLRRLRPERRPFVISRSGFAGLQRHALHWTGDNSSWWEHPWMSMLQLQTSGCLGSRGSASTSADFPATLQVSCLPAGWSSASSSRSVATIRRGTPTARSRGPSASRMKRISGPCCCCGSASCRISTRCSRSHTGLVHRSCVRYCSSFLTT